MNKQDLTNKIMDGLQNVLNESLNESKAFDPKNNKQHREAYNSFVKWFNRWKEKLGREEIRGLMRKVTNDALGDNLDTINERYNINEAAISGALDEHIAFDLFLTFQNTRSLHDMSQQMVDNLIRRLRKGEELSLETLANSSVVEKYAKATLDEYRRSVEGAAHLIISTATRKDLKRRIAQDLINDANDDYAFELHGM